MKITDEIRKKLREPLPKEAVTPHPTKSYLSSIKAIYVVERLNDVFGIGGWSVSYEVLRNTDKWVIVKGTMTIPEYGIFIEHFGGNDNADPGDAYKGAATDALTKIGSYLEIGIDVFKGLNHDHPKEQPKPKEQPIQVAEKPLLTKEQLSKAIARINRGELDVYKKIITGFRINPEYMKALEEAYNFQNNLIPEEVQ